MLYAIVLVVREVRLVKLRYCKEMMKTTKAGINAALLLAPFLFCLIILFGSAGKNKVSPHRSNYPGVIEMKDK